MKLIIRDTDYAVRALCFIAKSKKNRVPVSWLVRELNIPRPFLRRILQVLNQKKILNSYKGQGGGFSLAKPKEEISLIDLMKIFQGHIKLNECLFKKKICPNIKVCKLKKKIDKIEKHVLSELREITLAYLLKK